MRRWLGGALAVALLAAVWWWVWPASLGGRTTYAVTHGVSMLPRFHTGDLAIVRPAERYRIGDVVAYHSPTINAVVLHRIVKRQGEALVTKGDNNDWLDPDHPTSAEMLGTLRIRIPRGGSVLKAVTHPAVLAAVVGAIVLFTSKRTSRRGRRRTSPPPGASAAARAKLPRPSGRALPALAAAGAALLALGWLGASRPDTVPVAHQAPLDHVATLRYGAAVSPSPVYPSGRLVTGDPVFLRLVPTIDVELGYRVEPSEMTQLAGTRTVVAVLTATTGWRQETTLIPTERFTGGRFDATARVDLAEYARLVQTVERATGVPAGAYTLTLRADVHLRGALRGQPVDASFAPDLAFTLTPDQLKVTAPATGAAGTPDGTAAPGITRRHSTPVTWTSTEPAKLNLIGQDVPVALARRLGLAGGALLLACGVAWAAALRRRRVDGEWAAILHRFGPRIIPVSTVTEPAGRTVVDMTSMDALAKIAARYERYILHTRDQRGHLFHVDDDTALYRYQPGGPRDGARSRDLVPAGE